MYRNDSPVLLDRHNTPERRLLRAARAGTIVRVAPSIYAPAETARTLAVRCAALCKHDPEAVVLGRAAAALTWWPDLPVGKIEASRTGHVSAMRGFTWTQRSVPRAHVVEAGGVRMSDPALTVLDLVPGVGGKAIDEALRRRAATLAELHLAFAATPGRPGNTERAWLLDDSRDEPWSEPERLLHRIVRGLELPWRYRTNHPVVTGWRLAFLDLALPALRLGFEVDGYPYHSDPDAFENDRGRDLDLELEDWRIHRFTAEMVCSDAPWVGQTIAQLARLREKSLRAGGHAWYRAH